MWRTQQSASGTFARLLVFARKQAGASKRRCFYQWHTSSLLAFDVDGLECGLLSCLEDQTSLASRKANAAVIFALDQVFTTMVADELYAVARSSIRILVFALEGKPFHNGVKADIWLVPVGVRLACVYMQDKKRVQTYDRQIVESAARRSRETIMSNK